MEKLVVKKKEGIACWKVPCEDVCPNTVIELDEGVTLVVYVEGQRKLSAKRAFTIHSLLNPGKEKKLFGGTKAYESVELYAIDMATEFRSEWGFAGPTAIPCYDDEFKVDAKAVCFGEYYYVIDDFFSFIKTLPMGSKDEFTRDDMREYFRALTTSVARSYISSKLANKTLKECQAMFGEYSEEIKELINKQFDAKGLTINTFVISQLDFEPAHKINREKLKEARVDVKIKEVVNEGRRDDISVDKAESEIEIGLIRAKNGKGGNGGAPKQDAKTVKCPRCGEMNADVNYCAKCGESLKGNK